MSLSQALNQFAQNLGRYPLHMCETLEFRQNFICLVFAWVGRKARLRHDS